MRARSTMTVSALRRDPDSLRANPPHDSHYDPCRDEPNGQAPAACWFGSTACGRRPAKRTCAFRHARWSS